MPGLVEVARHAGLKPSDVKKFFASMVYLLSEGKPVKIQGFGSFHVYDIPGRTFASPVVNNGEPVVVPPSLGVKFSTSPITKGRINGAKRKRDKRARCDAAVMADPPKKAAKKPITATPRKRVP